jgi:cysteine-rich repeat protein
MRVGVVCLLPLSLFGCESGPRLLVDLRTDFVSGVEFHRVSTEVSGVDREFEREALRGASFADGVRVAEVTGVDAGVTAVTVRLLSADGSELARRTVVIEVRGSTGVSVVIARSCREIVCPDASTCVGGACASTRCVEASSPDCPPPQCAAASQCTAMAECASTRCADGLCLYADDASCGAGLYCVAETGCRPEPNQPDGGVDAGVDARDAGAACGNGTMEPGEECDDANRIDADGCEADCTLPRCANGIVDPGELCWSAAREHAPAVTVANVAIGDLDGDGDLDVVASPDGGEVLMLLNDGTGGLAAPIPLGIGVPDTELPMLNAIALADLNEDGRIDIAVANRGQQPLSATRSVAVLLARGGGLFEAPVNYPVVDGPRGVVAGDWDADGDLDLVTANFGRDGGSTRTRTISVLSNAGDGTFGPESTIDVGLDARPSWIVATDFDGRPGVDVATANFGVERPSGGATVVLNDRGATTVHRHAPSSADGTYAIAAGDINGDGAVDLAIASALSNQIHFLDALPTPGTFSFVDPGITDVRFPEAVALEDVDLDGDLDTMIASAMASELAVALNDGRGIVTQVDDACDGGRCIVAGVPVAIAVGDLNGDAVPDVVTGNLLTMPTSTHGVSVILSRP